MIGEREDILNKNQYGDLTMRPYVIDGNEINAFYDDDDDLVFVLDNTINQTKPNVLLVINPSGDKKWDEILSGQYNVDLETIRPKQDNKYQKLDIEYSGLSVYENLINAYVAGDDLSEHMIQLNILRDSAARHSAMTRLNVANEIIAKTNMTIVKTKESIVRLQNRIKTLRAKLSATKKEIGKVSTKQSAAKILKIESQIEAANEKLKRARKRLESAQKRLETATVDAELASDLLNQPATEIPSIEKNKPVMVAPKYELQATENESVDDTDDEDFEDDEDSDYDESKNEDENKYDDDEDEYENTDSNDEIKPLFDENPNNMNEEIAFKPINFDTPVVSKTNTNYEQSVPVFTPTQITENTEEETVTEDFDAPNITTDFDETKPVLESITPVNSDNSRPVLESITPIAPEQPIESMYSEQTSETQSEDAKPEMSEKPVVSSTPVLTGGDVPSMVNTFNADVTTATSRSRPTFIYYMLLIILIVLSVFTLWLYQKHMDTTEPLLTPDVVENVAADSKPKPVERLNIKKATKEIKNKVVKVTEPEPEEYEFVDDEDVSDTKSTVAEESKDTNVDNEPAVEPEQNVAEESLTEDEIQEPEPEIVEPETLEPESESLPDTEEQSAEVIADEGMDADVVSVDKPVYEVGPKHDDMIVSEQDYQANVQDVSEPEDETEEYYEE